MKADPKGSLEYFSTAGDDKVNPKKRSGEDSRTDATKKAKV